MRRLLLLATAAAMLAVPAIAQQPGQTEGVEVKTPGPGPSSAAAAMALTESDQQFVKKAVQGNLAEIQLGELATDKARNDDVKAFAQMMIQDHGAAHKEMQGMATRFDMDLPTEPGDEHKQEMQRLQGLSGAEFDQAYMRAMVADHEKSVKLYQKQAQEAEQQENPLNRFAAKTLPIIQEHLEMAQSLQAEISGQAQAR